MGNQKQKWTAQEEDALLAGIAKHGPGKWKNILRDPQFSSFLTQRSNIDLKDKWRNLSVSNSGQGSKDKSKAAKVKALNATSLAVFQNSGASDGIANAVVDDTASDGKTAPRYDAMIFEALSSVEDIKNGYDIGAMIRSIEQRHEVPQNFKRVLSSRLRTLVCQGKLEKVESSYRISNNKILKVKTPPLKQKDIRPQQLQNSGLTSGESVQEAAITAAYKVAEAENRSFLAAEAVKEAERVSRMAEDTEAMLQFVYEIYEQCNASLLFTSSHMADILSFASKLSLLICSLPLSISLAFEV